MANSIDDVLESRRLVRMYSSDAEGRLSRGGDDAQRLGQVLSHERPDPRDLRNPWRIFFEPWQPSTGHEDPVTTIISIESNKLREKWAPFLTSSPVADRLNITKSEPTVEGVVDLVKEVTAAAQSKRDSRRRGKAMKLFHNFCSTIDSHRSMLKLIPEGNEYVSIFTGTLNIIIQASVNHERIAEGLSEALCRISEHVHECKSELELFRTQAMTKLVADLYAHIFIFLSDTMDWITEKRRKRLLDSFNENFYKRFESQVETIRHKSDMIRNLAAQSSHAEQRVTRLTVEDLAQDIRLGLVGEERRHAEIVYVAEKIEKELSEGRRERQLLREEGQQFKQLADRLTSMLRDKAMVWIGDMHSIDKRLSPVSLLARPGDLGVTSTAKAGSSCLTEWNSEEIVLNSKHLEDFFHRDRVRLPDGSFNSARISSKIIGRLGEWVKDKSSRLLWLEGPLIEAADFDNPITILANKIVELTESSRIPVISYCCEIRRREQLKPGNDTREAQSCVALVCALIRQMAELLLPRFTTHSDFSLNRLQLIDGSILCWSQMLDLFQDLLSLMPNTMLCIIDSFQWLDDRTTTIYLEELVQAIRNSGLKCLFTTTGRSACLIEQLQANETVVIESADLRQGPWGLGRNNSWALAQHDEASAGCSMVDRM
ncbi:hypothetical protein F4813DRAFT_351692 [Daldinia decipiens]|uniref:uncharacterized protein n=1 Tax=Daldinia decipiens TaxID=326647 RepID=UPI0020C2A935|nr:uncharacterized protein F4813DRAFT_351692 [Daldinia decipiens]KAI1659700.1 hypothetical protein F4813DRAFT_351692 [Daldinia decipiens]